jgi:hypothetical protein
MVFMAKNHIRALLLPNKTSVLVSTIASTGEFEEGVGIMNERGRMIGWIEITAADPEVRNSHFYRVLMILNDIINNPRQSAQPDFSFLDESNAA